MKIDTGRLVKTLKDEPYQYDGRDLTVGHAMAEALASNDAGGKMKLFILAQKAYKSDGEMEVDEVDLALIKKAVEACGAYNNLILGQVLLAIDAAK